MLSVLLPCLFLGLGSYQAVKRLSEPAALSGCPYGRFGWRALLVGPDGGLIAISPCTGPSRRTVIDRTPSERSGFAAFDLRNGRLNVFWRGDSGPLNLPLVETGRHK